MSGMRGAKKNNTPFKSGDVITFSKDIKKLGWRSSKKQVVIPKYSPAIIEKINDSHVWVKYKGETHWLRTQLDRMAFASEAAKILFGEKDGN